MNKVATKPKAPGRARKLVHAQLAKLKEQMDDMQDYLALLDARARNEGKPTQSMADVRRKLGMR